MKQKITFILLLLLCTTGMMAQPKWVKKARKSLVNIVTYDATGQLLHSTNGFFIDAKGTALTDYHSFRGATRAVAITEEGKEYPVSCIEGASSLYDVLKIRVQIKKSNALTLAAGRSVKGEEVFVMPYLSNKSEITTPTTIADVATFNDTYAYYTLPLTIADKNISCPLMNEEGEVVAIVQKAAKTTDANSYAVAADYINSLSINALSATASDYREIPMKKALPADASQAYSFIFLSGLRDTALYLSYIDDYTTLFPKEPGGYTLRAELLAQQGHYAEASEAWEAGIAAKAPEDQLRYARAQTIFQLIQAQQNLPESWTLEQAMHDVETAEAINNVPMYRALHAKLLYAQKRYAEACASFLELNNTNLRSADNFLYAAQCQQMLADTVAVLALQDSAVACFTKPYVEAAAPALLMRATTLVGMGRYREAVRDLNDYEHLKANELTANFYYQREQAEMRCRMFQQALDDIERAVRMSPQEPLFQAERAVVNYRFNHIDEAIAAAQAAIALDEEFADAHRILGICLRQQGREAEARAALQRAAELGDALSHSLLEQ